MCSRPQGLKEPQGTKSTQLHLTHWGLLGSSHSSQGIFPNVSISWATPTHTSETLSRLNYFCSLQHKHSILSSSSPKCVSTCCFGPTAPGPLKNTTWQLPLHMPELLPAFTAAKPGCSQTESRALFPQDALVSVFQDSVLCKQHFSCPAIALLVAEKTGWPALGSADSQHRQRKTKWLFCSRAEERWEGSPLSGLPFLGL